MLVAPDGLVYRRPVTIAERRDAFDYAVLFQGGPACINPDDAGLPSNVVETSLRHYSRICGGLFWTLAFDGDLMVGGLADGLHPEDGVHRYTVVSWTAPGYDSDIQRNNMGWAALNIVPEADDCCGGDWKLTLPSNSLEYDCVYEMDPDTTEILVPRLDGSEIPSGLVTLTAHPSRGPYSLLG